MEAGNRLLLPWRHGVSPAPVDFHHYILSASMAQQRGFDRTESRNTREHVTDVLWRQEWDSNPQAMFEAVGFRDRLATITTPCRVAKREGLEPSNPICRGQTD